MLLFRMFFRFQLLLQVIFFSFTGLSLTEEMPELAKLGRQLFYDPSFGGSVDPKKATGFSCTTCHADFKESEYSDGLIRSGNSIVGVTRRQKSQWKEIQPNQLLRSAGGAGVCYQRFLQGIPAKKVNPIAIPEQKAEALMAYFDYVTRKAQVGETEQVSYNPLSRTEAQAAADKILKLDGDADKGWKLYGKSCAGCHSGPKKRGIGTQLVRSRPPSNLEARLHKIASYTRQGGYLMPALGTGKLSDQDLANIIEFLRDITEAKK
ncbi:hypothetical protein CMK18_14535 [Candidatus Poribacteria bacterium]|nr:hypothetical protein [Candidatus Poribacteria bacterium]